MYADRIIAEAETNDDRPSPTAPASVFQPSHYGGGRRLSWPAVGGVVAGHVVLLAALLTLDVVTVSVPKPTPIMVEMLALPDDPPPVPPAEAKVEPFVRTDPPIVAPPPMVRTVALAPPPVLTSPAPSPPRAAVVASEAPPAAAPSAPVSVADLSTTMISATPPRYPIESRRRREEGTVVLSVLLSTNGNVSEVSIHRSSGFDRLDRAALQAVRRWRWSPTIRDGQPVMVRGIVEIPFELR